MLGGLAWEQRERKECVWMCVGGWVGVFVGSLLRHCGLLSAGIEGVRTGPYSRARLFISLSISFPPSSSLTRFHFLRLERPSDLVLAFPRVEGYASKNQTAISGFRYIFIS